MSNPRQRHFTSDVINTKNHWLIGTIWTAMGSKGNKYNITMHGNGFQCDCPAFRKCKHITEIEERLSDETYERYQ